MLPEGEHRRVFVDRGHVTYEAPAGAEPMLLAERVWLVPGLVDAHCHVGLGPHGGEPPEVQEQQAIQDRDAGTLTIRDCGAPVDTRWIDERDDLPDIIRAGRHIARPKRYLRDVGREVEPVDLVATVEQEAARGDGWVKLVGDWIDRDTGDLAPLWPRATLDAAIARAHELGVRVTAHTFGEDALPDLLGAGIDCIEHGTGLSADLIHLMAERQVALVPTLINIDRFPAIADSADRFPTYARHMRDLHRTARRRVREAFEAGVPIYAGTDAGGGIDHGRIGDEVLALHRAGIPATQALAAASWSARAWLRTNSGLAEGSPANFVVYDEAPTELTTVIRPRMVVLHGGVFGV